ncbi:LIM domain only protein 3-like, partial [Diaphorina citri]|uniref:LIM domain only protein 3-like n=1 Tax=Diaphorina citri TaxID=121845 RepID=A0A1S3DE20_DIACI
PPQPFYAVNKSHKSHNVKTRFCVGDRFYLCENKILCEYDYEERMVFANMAYNPNTIAQLKRHASHLPHPAKELLRFCVGDRFYLCENKILCEYDYEERMVFANMAYNPNTIAQLKRHASHLPVSETLFMKTKLQTDL